MAEGRHSYVPFYPSDWLGGTARLPRLHKSVYFDICCYIWDHAKACPDVEARVMVADLKNGIAIIDDLVALGKLSRHIDGSLVNDKALAEATKAMALWTSKRTGGQKGGKTSAQKRAVRSTPSSTPSRYARSTPSMTASTEPEPEHNPFIPLRSAVEAAPALRDGRAASGDVRDAQPIGSVLDNLQIGDTPRNGRRKGMTHDHLDT